MKDDLSGVEDSFHSAALGIQRQRIVEVDFGRYQAMIDDPLLSEAQKRQMIEGLWVFIVAFVDLGFGLHPVQQACGQPQLSLDTRDRRDSDDGRVPASIPHDEP